MRFDPTHSANNEQAATAVTPRKPGVSMTNKMTPKEEHDFYADPDNQVLRGPARRRRGRSGTSPPTRQEQLAARPSPTAKPVDE